jgi:PKD repeat protein
MKPATSSLRAVVGAACVLGLFSLSAAAQLTITPTTTLSAETANNTSASSSFKSQSNGNAAAGNVSKLSIRTLLYPGSTTKVYAAVMPWFGRSDHMSVGYNSSDAGTISAQVTDMLSRGIQGAIIPWYGSDPGIQSAMAINFMNEAQSRGNFEFAIMIDVGALVSYAQQNGCDVTTQLINHLNYIAGTFYASPAYTKVDGRPVLYLFGVEAYYIDWNKVRSSVSGNPMFLVRNQNAFGDPQADGAYSWVEINRSNPNDMMLSYLDDFYVAAQSSSKYTVGSTYKGFNDNLADWGSNRVINQQCARTWLNTFGEINKYYSSSHQLSSAQLVTWNDYEEGSEMETGIDNCVALTASVSASTLSWSIGGGNEEAVDHYTVFISTDGQNLAKLGDVAPGMHSLNLSQYGLTPGVYVLYVKAIGKASIVNHISPAVAFNPANQAPVAALSLNTTSGPAPLAITASSANSSDPDGSITLVKIDFGDGAVLSGGPGFSATHTYNSKGTFTVTLTVTDNGGVFSTTQTTVTVAAGPGVTVTSPSAGSTVNSPVHVAATAVINGGVSYMEVLVDGVTPPAFITTGAAVDTFLKINAGAHQIRVVAHDTTPAANFIFSDVSITVGANDVPPTARLTVDPFGGGNQVLACTATSTDLDGSIVDSRVDFGDGATASGPTAFHTYSSPGTYNVTATVTDNQGVSSTTSSQVTVGGTGGGAGSCVAPTSPGVNICSPLNGSTVASPFTIQAAGKTTNTTDGMDVWLDGNKLKWFLGATSIDFTASASDGTHRLDIYAVGVDGEKKLSTSTFTVSSAGGGGTSQCPIPTSPGVTICSPLSSTTSSPLNILASGRDSVTTAGMDVWMDGIKLKWFAGSNTADLTVNASAGTHLLEIYAVGTNGELQKGSVTFTITASTTCAVPSSPGVNICSPVNNSTVASPIHVWAAGRDHVTTDGMDVWLDGRKLGFFAGNIVDISVANVGPGSHQLDIYAVGVDGEKQKATVFFTGT